MLTFPFPLKVSSAVPSTLKRIASMRLLLPPAAIPPTTILSSGCTATLNTTSRPEVRFLVSLPLPLKDRSRRPLGRNRASPI
jgi:hypothetical protein